ncbi:uncharacterized protein LOC123907059 [Trifolium pratense]|uniref:uncharacterized protein LOC123907059 n=1 Tax=Trifolium pratense TaxID=57577 RepID=UPI001E694915|nr:uncharacterized protein LOC123907059 [Trifolium pratense]
MENNKAIIQGSSSIRQNDDELENEDSYYISSDEEDICPIIQEKLEQTKRVADRWQPTWHHDDDFAIFGVTNGTETYIVNLIQKTCTCRKWDLTGIPCCHAIACIWHNKKEPEDFVSSYYRKSTFMATYSHIILPTNGPQLWRISKTMAINPPVVRRAIGRPKKNRNKANDEKKIHPMYCLVI